VFWLLLWLILAAAILLLTFWTFAILLKQKSIWAAYAEQNNLKLIKTGLLTSPQIEGPYKDLVVQIFSERQAMPDGRGQQYRTIIQFPLLPNMPTDGIIASRYFTPFVEGLGLPKKWTLPKDIKWEEEPIARAAIAGRLKTYLTEDRIRSLEVLAGFKRASFVFIFDESEAFLRVESADPLDDIKRMENIVHKVYAIAQILCVKEEEVEPFNALAKREERIDRIGADDDEEEDDEE
jgi:hypothetical protein